MVFTIFAVLLFVVAGYLLVGMASLVRVPNGLADLLLSGIVVAALGAAGILNVAHLLVAIWADLGFAVVLVLFVLIIFNDFGENGNKSLVGWLFSFGRIRFSTDYVPAKDRPFGRLVHALGLVHFHSGFAIRHVEVRYQGNGLVRARLVIRATVECQPGLFGLLVADAQKDFERFTVSPYRTNDYRKARDDLYYWKPPGPLTAVVQDVEVYPPSTRICAPPRVADLG